MTRCPSRLVKVLTCQPAGEPTTGVDLRKYRVRGGDIALRAGRAERLGGRLRRGLSALGKTLRRWILPGLRCGGGSCLGSAQVSDWMCTPGRWWAAGAWTADRAAVRAPAYSRPRRGAGVVTVAVPDPVAVTHEAPARRATGWLVSSPSRGSSVWWRRRRACGRSTSCTVVAEQIRSGRPSRDHHQVTPTFTEPHVRRHWATRAVPACSSASAFTPKGSPPLSTLTREHRRSW